MKQDTKVFKDILIKVYDNFYYRLVSDPYFAEFFKNKDVEEIKRKQRKNLIKNYNRFIKGNLG